MDIARLGIIMQKSKFPIISYSVRLEVSPVVSLKASHWSSVAC